MFLFHGCVFIPCSTYVSVMIRHKKEKDQLQLFREHWCNFSPQFLIVRGPDVWGKEMQLSSVTGWEVLTWVATCTVNHLGGMSGLWIIPDFSNVTGCQKDFCEILHYTGQTIYTYFFEAVSLNCIQICIEISGAEIPFTLEAHRNFTMSMKLDLRIYRDNVLCSSRSSESVEPCAELKAITWEVSFPLFWGRW